MKRNLLLTLLTLVAATATATTIAMPVNAPVDLSNILIHGHFRRKSCTNDSDRLN